MIGIALKDSEYEFSKVDNDEANAAITRFLWKSKQEYGVFSSIWVQVCTININVYMGCNSCCFDLNQLYESVAFSGPNIVVYGEPGLVVTAIQELGRSLPQSKDMEFYIPIRNDKDCCGRPHHFNGAKVQHFGSDGFDGLIFTLSNLDVGHRCLHERMFRYLTHAVCFNVMYVFMSNNNVVVRNVVKS